jgi:hypothetical protein
MSSSMKDQTERDPVTNAGSGGKGGGNSGMAGGSPKNATLLNGKPRIRSLSGGGPSYTSGMDPKGSFPVADSPYRGKGER